MLEFIKNKRTMRLAILVVTGVGVLALSYHLSSIINPLLIALIIAYILNPLVNRIESLQVKVRGYRLRTGRTGAVAIIYLLSLSAFLRQPGQMVIKAFIRFLDKSFIESLFAAT